MNEQSLNGRDTCINLVMAPAEASGWNELTLVREEVCFANLRLNDCNRSVELLCEDKPGAFGVPASGNANFVGERLITLQHQDANQRTSGARIQAACLSRSVSVL